MKHTKDGAATFQCKSYDELPQNAKIYLKKLEELLGIKITIISVGPDREQTIFLQ